MKNFFKSPKAVLPSGFFVQNRLHREKQVHIYTIYKRKWGFWLRKKNMTFFKEIWKKVLTSGCRLWYYNWAVNDGKPLERAWKNISKKCLTNKTSRDIINKLSREGERHRTLKIEQYRSLNGTLSWWKITLNNSNIQVIRGCKRYCIWEITAI